LPRRRPGQRAPLWAQRRRSADLLRAASKYPEFPILLESFRECLRDVFDVPGLRQVLEQVQRREIRLSRVETRSASPFASSLLFSYVGNFMYEGDAPLAERRAQALTIDPAQLRALLGEAELRSLLDPDAIAEVEHDVQRRQRPLEHADMLHDLLIAIGDLSHAELCQRADAAALDGWLTALERARRVIRVPIAGETRYAAAEDAGRLRDALGVVVPRGLPQAFLESVGDPLGDLVSRHARCHGPFPLTALQARYGLAAERLRPVLDRLTDSGRLARGAFLAGGHDVEWCDAEVLRRIKQKSLIKLRREVEPVSPAVYARLAIEWQGVASPRGGPDALPTVLEQLEGYPLVASVLERPILAARVRNYSSAELDALTSSGEFVWRGLETIGSSDGRVALYRADRYALLAPPATPVEGALAEAVRAHLRQHGASFFAELVAKTRAFPPDLLETLWSMVYAGELSNDTLAPLRARVAQAKATRERPQRLRAARPRAHMPPGSEGRWSLLERWLPSTPPSTTETIAARVEVLLERYGVLPREAIAADGLGTFSELYPVLKALEESGRIRRGYFVAGLGAAQFARAGADDRLRALRREDAGAGGLVLAATDPANPFGAALPWPDGPERPQRAAGALVVLYQGALLAYLARGEKSLATFLPAEEPERTRAAEVIADSLFELVDGVARRALVLSSIDGDKARGHAIGPLLERAGFAPVGEGYVLRHGRSRREGSHAGR
jgi:ATP-dependent Lhr-like helicase